MPAKRKAEPPARNSGPSVPEPSKRAAFENAARDSLHTISHFLMAAKGSKDLYSKWVAKRFEEWFSAAGSRSLDEVFGFKPPQGIGRVDHPLRAFASQDRDRWYRHSLLTLRAIGFKRDEAIDAVFEITKSKPWPWDGRYSNKKVRPMSKSNILKFHGANIAAEANPEKWTFARIEEPSDELLGKILAGFPDAAIPDRFRKRIRKGVAS